MHQPILGRHPDITYSAHVVFSVIGAALFLEVLGYYVVNGFFWSLFILCYFVLLITFSILTYYNGMFRQFRASWREMFNSCRKGERRAAVLRPTRRRAFVLTVFVIVVNCLLATFIIAMRRPGVQFNRLLGANLGQVLGQHRYIQCKHDLG